MAKKNNIFDDFLNKNFGEEPVRIEKPVGGDRTTSTEDREAIAKAAVGEKKPVQEEAPKVVDEPVAGRGPGRPKNEGRGPVKNMNFLMEESIRYDLEMLKVRQHRSSLTELLNEAIVDLLKKYKVEGY